MRRHNLGIALMLLLAFYGNAQPSGALLEDRWLYHPVAGRTLDPGRLGLGVEDRYFPSQDATRLNAWWMPARPGRPTFLYFHGNGGSLSSMDRTLKLFARADFGALIVDYRGYGLSQGRPSEGGLYQDGLAAYDYCRLQGVPASHIVIHGQSLGGAVASYVAEHRPCAGLVLESTFTSFPAVAAQVVGVGVASRLALAGIQTEFHSLRRMPHLKVPLLVIHGDRDELIPCAMGRRLYTAAPAGNKQLWVVEGAGHNNLRSRSGELFCERLCKFWISASRRKFSP